MENLNVIYEDNHVIVVEKPCGILSQADKSGDEDMLSIVKQYIKVKYEKKGEVFLGLVHRLDTVTSGLMVFARTSKAASRLSDQIRKNQIKKYYLAVFEGEIQKKSASLEDYLIKDRNKNTVRVTKDEKNGKKCLLNYRVINVKKSMTIAKIELVTGRSHQIRVQFSSRKHPIYGDAKYGAKNKEKKGIALHAYRLEFIHPTKKENMSFTLLPDRHPFDIMLEGVDKENI